MSSQLMPLAVNYLGYSWLGEGGASSAEAWRTRGHRKPVCRRVLEAGDYGKPVCRRLRGHIKSVTLSVWRVLEAGDYEGTQNQSH